MEKRKPHRLGKKVGTQPIVVGCFRCNIDSPTLEYLTLIKTPPIVGILFLTVKSCPTAIYMTKVTLGDTRRTIYAGIAFGPKGIYGIS